MILSKKTDNHNLPAKLELRRHFLRKYHGPETNALLDVLDCCQGAGMIWRELRKDFQTEKYVGVDLKPQKGRLKIDSVRILDQPGWTFNVIDVDTYGAPWKHWFAVLKHAPNECAITIFLTIGIVNIGGISSQADLETRRAMGLDVLLEKFKAKHSAFKIPQSLSGLARDRIGFAACIGAAENLGFTIAELIESENEGGHARYIGARLTRGVA